MSSVTAYLRQITFPTYAVGHPERNPVFFEKRVYQGSSGKVYPVPFIDTIEREKRPRTYIGAILENEFVRLMLLPEIGGRIHVAQDKTNNDYDFFYRQNVIKPALVGLAGPWISGGVEFNWPQHHRPSTFLPADIWIEEEPDGARTIWCSEHDPMLRMKGMHGLRLRPGSALVELRVRLFNRTPLTQAFLWWANAAVRVHDQYQSFFPPDVHYVADHAKRSITAFPVAQGVYYGVNYGERPGANDLTWYRNIPVPTSYMVMKSNYDFVGGYDHRAQSGFVHIANRHIAPGKKQWTWGNDLFGRTWDRELSDDQAPYIELMGGVYTDNQPDFSYLAPYETKVFSQFWWPIHGIGPVQNANTRAAIRLVISPEGYIDAGVAAPTRLEGIRLILTDGDRQIANKNIDLLPGACWRLDPIRFENSDSSPLELSLRDSAGNLILSYRPHAVPSNISIPEPAHEPRAPQKVSNQDLLYLIGEHLRQYSHPTRYAELYWTEGLKRDPLDYRCNLALGQQCIRRAQFDEAVTYLERAIDRITSLHPNPVSGEAFYFLGLACRFLRDDQRAYEAFYKACWDYAWRAPGHYQLALLDCRQRNFEQALQHLDLALVTNNDNNHAHTLRAIILRKLGQTEESKRILETVLAKDPLDHWTRWERSRATGPVDQFFEVCRNDAQTILDLAFDYADAGFFTDALGLIAEHETRPFPAAAVPNPLGRTPMITLVRAWLQENAGQTDLAVTSLAEAEDASPDFLFPSRLSEFVVLDWAIRRKPSRNAGYALGNYLFDLRRHEDAIRAWEKSLECDPNFPTVVRNLGIAYWNAHRDGPSARAMYERAVRLDPEDTRMLFEYDQLRKKLNDPSKDRLEYLLARIEQVSKRDDLSTEFATLLNLADRPEDALRLISSRQFHPWEGGEGQILREYKMAHVKIGRQALANNRPEEALNHFESALLAPPNLGEAFHYLQAEADVLYWQGCALQALGKESEALARFEQSAGETGDFLQMAVTAHSELSYYRGLSLAALGCRDEARHLFGELRDFASNLEAKPAVIDYFATSLPDLLVFEDDLDARQSCDATYLRGLAEIGLGNEAAARECFLNVLSKQKSHVGAQDHLAAL
jgi:tetratricopeptide (TPR) repeat protein